MLASGEIREVGFMADLHATYFDAIAIYDFLEKTIIPNINDITIMSSKMDFYRLFKKPSYEGDFLSQMFDWNLNTEEA